MIADIATLSSVLKAGGLGPRMFSFSELIFAAVQPRSACLSPKCGTVPDEWPVRFQPDQKGCRPDG